MAIQIVSRAEWGAAPPKNTPFRIALPTPELWLHHSASPDGGAERVRAIQKFHQDVRGWNDIAYSFLVNGAGTVFEGRGAGIAGGHTKGRNTVSHGVCALGNYDTTTPSQVMLDTIRQLLAHGHQEGWWPSTFTGGHRDAPGAATSCPGGKLYALIPDLNTPPLEEPVMLPINAQSPTENIRLVQGRLGIPDNGSWDATTITAVKALAVRANTGDPVGKAGTHVNGRMYNQLTAEFVAANTPPSGGLNEAQVKALITSTGGQLFVEKGKPVVIRGS